MIDRIRVVVGTLVFTVAAAAGAAAQAPAAAAVPVAVESPTLAAGYTAPPTLVRAADGTATMRATRLTSPLSIDGRLTEEIYGEIPPASDFIQQDPREGDPAHDKTEVWVFFD